MAVVRGTAPRGATRHSSGFTHLQIEYLQKDESYQRAKTALWNAWQVGGNESIPQAAVAKAWEDRDRVLGTISRLSYVNRPHVFTADYRGEEGYQSIVARPLAHDLHAQGVSHPVIVSGLMPNRKSALLAVKAVSARLGVEGYRLSWERLDGAGGNVPSQIWIDSGQTPHERARNVTATEDQNRR